VLLRLHSGRFSDRGGAVRSRVSWKCIVGTPAGGQGSKAVYRRGCLELGVSVG
jgi:hypothetical protein